MTEAYSYLHSEGKYDNPIYITVDISSERYSGFVPNYLFTKYSLDLEKKATT